MLLREWVAIRSFPLLETKTSVSSDETDEMHRMVESLVARICTRPEYATLDIDWRSNKLRITCSDKANIRGDMSPSFAIAISWEVR